MAIKSSTDQALLAENEALRIRLEEAEETLRAIRTGEVDALVVQTSAGSKVFTLQGQDAELNRFRGEILEQISDAVIVLDGDQHIAYLNTAAEQQYGVIALEMLGRHVAEMYQCHWPNPEDETAMIAALNETGQWRGEEAHIKLNGETIQVESTITRRYSGNGSHPGLLSVIRDITERKQAEQALKDAARHKDEFLAMLGHELRNPLTPISYVAQILGSQPLTGTAITKASEMLTRNVAHISHLVDDLLDISRISLGLITIQKERVRLPDLLNYAIESVQALAQSKKQTLNLQLPSQPVYLEGDPVRLTQVFTNLLKNAVKYTGEGGFINLNVDVEGPVIVIRIQDNGLGIESQLLPHLFDLFIQGVRGLDQSEGGLGLGLNLVKKLVELHNGEVMAYSQGAGQGSEFVVQLPKIVTKTTQAEQVNPQDLTREGDQALRVLLIDDDKDVVDSISLWFEMKGHQVEAVYNGAQGLAVAKQIEPDIILLDIELPDINGYQLALRLREQPSLQQTLLVAMRGYTRSKNNQSTEPGGFDHYLIKPPKLSELESLVADFQRSKQRAQSFVN